MPADILARASSNKERFFKLIDKDEAAAKKQPLKTIAKALGLNDGEMGEMRNKNLADTMKAAAARGGKEEEEEGEEGGGERRGGGGGF